MVTTLDFISDTALWYLLPDPGVICLAMFCLAVLVSFLLVLYSIRKLGSVASLHLLAVILCTIHSCERYPLNKHCNFVAASILTLVLLTPISSSVLIMLILSGSGPKLRLIVSPINNLTVCSSFNPLPPNNPTPDVSDRISPLTSSIIVGAYHRHYIPYYWIYYYLHRIQFQPWVLINH